MKHPGIKSLARHDHLLEGIQDHLAARHALRLDLDVVKSDAEFAVGLVVAAPAAFFNILPSLAEGIVEQCGDYASLDVEDLNADVCILGEIIGRVGHRVLVGNDIVQDARGPGLEDGGGDNAERPWIIIGVSRSRFGIGVAV